MRTDTHTAAEAIPPMTGSGQPLRLLFVTTHLPFPPRSGGRVREWELLRRLDGVEIRLVACSKEPFDPADRAALLEHCRSVDVFPVDPHRAPPTAPALLRRHWCPAAASVVRDRLGSGQIDLVHVEGFHAEQLVSGQLGMPLVLAEQNIEYQLGNQRAALAVDKRERRALRAEAKATKVAEVAAWRRARVCITVTELDRRTAQRAAPTTNFEVVPDGVTPIAAVDGTSPEGRGSTVLFLANYAYEPNLDAARHLCQNIWPRVRARNASAELVLAGRAPPEELRALAHATAGVNLVGEVDDVASPLRGADVVVCPLRIGGGVKVKVLEALAHRRCIVTTSIGAQGLEEVVTAGGLGVADDPEHFAAMVASYLANGRARAEVAERGHQAAQRLPTWDEAAERLLGIYRRCVADQMGRIDAGVPA